MNLYDDIRKEYQTRGLRRADLHPDPFHLFDQWFQQAVETRPGKWLEPNAMTLSTCADQIVTSRTVLLKHHDHQQLTFFTSYQSEKGQQLAINSNASLLFHWAWQGRQIRICGYTRQTDRQTSFDYFSSRPWGAQIAALASAQSSVIQSRAEFDQLRNRLAQKHPNGSPVPLPDHWGGYHLIPGRWEFWQGREDRSHDRFRYSRPDPDGVWNIERLAP